LITARSHPETLFVIRAHPDEARIGKASEESVAEWADARGMKDIPNLHFIPPQEYVNSYDLIRMAKFVLIYNSTIGLEASILGAAVLSAGKARFTASEVAWLPETKAAYQAKLDSFLDAERLRCRRTSSTTPAAFSTGSFTAPRSASKISFSRMASGRGM